MEKAAYKGKILVIKYINTSEFCCLCTLYSKYFNPSGVVDILKVPEGGSQC